MTLEQIRERCVLTIRIFLLKKFRSLLVLTELIWWKYLDYYQYDLHGVRVKGSNFTELSS